MNADKAKITFAVDGETFGNFKLRDGGRRMKLYIKLNKEETEQWHNLSQALTGGNVSNDTLARIMFFKGIHAITAELNERVENMTDDEKKAIMKSMTPEQADAAMEMAEEEFAGVDEDENTEKAND
jgi:hypothetical protein|tara:strand:- start:1925 stop:2302 length:378 start_codon:yes stop_codon:yes gene_type:complete